MFAELGMSETNCRTAKVNATGPRDPEQALEKLTGPSVARKANGGIRRQGRRREMAATAVARHAASIALDHCLWTDGGQGLALPGLWGQRGLLSLQPASERRERADLLTGLTDR